MTHDDTAAHLAGGLPPFFPSSPSSGNYDLLKPIADEIDQAVEDIEAVDNATTPQGNIGPNLTIDAGSSATIPAGEVEYYHSVMNHGSLTVDGQLVCLTLDNQGSLTVNGSLEIVEDFAIARLREIGKLIKTLPKENEGFEHYRARLIIEHGKLTSEGTIRDLLATTAEVLDMNTVTDLGYEEPSGGEHGTALLEIPRRALNNTTVSDSEVISLLDKIIPAGYRLDGVVRGTFTYITPTEYNFDNHDPAKAYDGTDNNGNAKDNGGDYAGLLN